MKGKFLLSAALITVSALSFASPAAAHASAGLSFSLGSGYDTYYDPYDYGSYYDYQYDSLPDNYSSDPYYYDNFSEPYPTSGWNADGWQQDDRDGDEADEDN